MAFNKTMKCLHTYNTLMYTYVCTHDVCAYMYTLLTVDRQITSKCFGLTGKPAVRKLSRNFKLSTWPIAYKTFANKSKCSEPSPDNSRLMSARWNDASRLSWNSARWNRRQRSFTVCIESNTFRTRFGSLPDTNTCP